MISLLWTRGDRDWNTRVEPHHRFIGVGGDQALHVIDLPPPADLSGVGVGDPVLLVHGYGDSTYSWHRNVAALTSAGFRAILVDQPGLGRSVAPPGHRFGVEDQAGAILAAADGLGLERFHLVGHSMGGAIALYLCLHHPRRVRGSIVIAPVTKRPSRRLLLAHRGAWLVAEALASRAVFAHTLRQVYHDGRKLRPEVVAEYARPARRRGYWRDMARLSRGFFSEAFDQLVQRLDVISTKPLVLWGQQDRWLSARRGPFLARTIEGARLEVIPAAGHNVHQERPGTVNELMLRHLFAPPAGKCPPFARKCPPADTS